MRPSKLDLTYGPKGVPSELSPWAGDTIPVTHLIIPLALFLLYVVWVVVFQLRENANAREADQNTITAGDFSVWLSGFSSVAFRNDRLVELARQYGDVVGAFHVPLLGSTLASCGTVRATLRRASVLQVRR